MRRLSIPGPRGRFYAPTPSLGLLARVAMVGAVVTTAAWIARSTVRGAADGVATERADDEPWPFPTAAHHPEPDGAVASKDVDDDPATSLAEPASHAV